MKQVVKTLVVVGAMVAAGSVAADLGDIWYSLGVDFQQNWTKGKNGYDLYFPKSFPGANVYVGAKFNENFGVEVGGDWSANKKHNWTENFKNPANVNFTATGTAKVRRSGYHLDLVGSLPLNECFDVFATAGFGYVKNKVSMTVNSMVPASSAYTNSYTGLSSKGKGVFRLGIGGLYQITEMFGVRAKLGWENTSRLTVSYPASPGFPAKTDKAFKDTISLALGVFARF